LTETALIRKCAEGDDMAALLLLEAGADAKLRAGQPPPLLLYLITTDLAPNLLLTPRAPPPEDSGKTPLHWAAENRMQSVVQRLCESSANVNATDSFGQTAIYFASKNNDYEMVKALVGLKSSYTKLNYSMPILITNPLPACR
jgi:ankyrin repeat protein